VVKSVKLIIVTILLAACASVSPSSNSSGRIQEDGAANEPGEPVMEAQKPAEAPKSVRADLEDLGPAPELVNQVWVNTDQPLRLEDLRGKVVLLDMWTFG
jgi:hypothetical protein